MGELFRYRKAGRTRAYSLRVLSERESELWVLSETRGGERTSRKLAIFTSDAEAKPFLEEVEKELRSGGWVDVSG